MKKVNRINVWITIIFVIVFSSCKKENAIGSTLSGPQKKQITIEAKNIPIFVNKSETEIVSVKIIIPSTGDPCAINKISCVFSSESTIDNIAEIKFYCTQLINGSHKRNLIGSVVQPKLSSLLKMSASLVSGENQIQIIIIPKPNADLIGKLQFENLAFTFSDNVLNKMDMSSLPVFRFAKILCAAGQDQCDTYRIPGFVTTNKGTLVAVYDNRYLNSGDLQGDINIGMSRSLDGGKTWDLMKVIMDMGEWGGKPNAENGIGDPCVLVDRITNTIWVAALWFHGNPGKTAWGYSKPGLSPEQTGQFVLVKSEDDGLTWSKPINITEMVKNPAWYLFFQGPGMGITLEDGTLVFPAQYKDANQVPFSTLIYSKDHGATWTSGIGAKSNTTESQVVQLKDGSLMLNMRDDRNRTEKGDKNGRAVATTKDLGLTWTTHSSSNSALPESNCMASLIGTTIDIGGVSKHVLFFSNPNNKTTRSNMTIKASLDEGNTWPLEYQLELNSEEGYGYSCLTMIDGNTLGILYEGVKDLFFQKVPVSDVLKGLDIQKASPKRKFNN
ncbi:MAG: exo-alpha-sialidase [Bacteroidetes bacterium]|nr:exo-alpha-sialidase [Bacteroidota bacterium]